jgi:hypothetical protein
VASSFAPLLPLFTTILARPSMNLVLFLHMLLPTI